MKELFIILFSAMIISCNQQPEQKTTTKPMPIHGTWKLLTGTLKE